MTSLYDKMTELADACRKRFGGTSKLTIDDMIITPSVSPSGTEILGGTVVRIGTHKSDIPLTLEAVPPAMSKPIKLSITVYGDGYIHLNAKLIFNKSDGTQLVLDIPSIDTDWKDGESWVKTVSVTIPANTSIVNNKAILRLLDDYNNFDMIERIIATY